MKVTGYIRVSTDEQGKSGLGLEAQTDKIKAYCSLYDLELVSIHVDTFSGKSMNREGLQEALAELTTGKAEGIIVAKLDRLTRSVKDLGFLLETYFEKYSLFVVAEQVDTRSAAGRLVLNILVSVAQWERETIGERTKDALKAKKARGEKTGGVPFGYRMENGNMVEEPTEQEIISLIGKLNTEGYSDNAIAQWLNRHGYRTKAGKEWRNVQVNRVLRRSNEITG